MRTLLILSLLAAPLSAASPDAKPSWLDAWKPLVGEWVAEGAGAPGTSSGRFSFAPGLSGHVLVRHNHAEGPAANGRPAYSHDDLMVLSPAGNEVRASYWDNEGHVIEYTCGAKGSTWSCATRGSTPAFRLDYALTAPDALAVTFSIAPSGKEADFKPYLTGTAHRAK